MTAHRRILYRPPQRRRPAEFFVLTVLAPEPRTGPERSPLLTHSKWTVCFCGEYRPGGVCGDCGYETTARRHHRQALAMLDPDYELNLSLQRSLDAESTKF